MRSWLTPLAFGLVSALAPAALAEPGEPEKLVARELMAQGRVQREAKDLRGALASFSKAHAIMHVPTTLLEAARANADVGLWLEALELLGELGAEPPRAGEPAPFAPARVEAQKLQQSLEKRMPSLRVDLNGSPRSDATQLWIDGIERPDCVRICRLNPGTHVVSVRAPGARADEQIHVAEAEAAALELVFSPALPLAESARVNPYRARAAPVQALNGDGPPARVPTATWALGGVAVLGLGTGAALGLSAVSQRDELRRQCAPNCAPGDVDAVRRRAVFANLSFGVGAAAAAVAVMTYVFSLHKAGPSRDSGSPRQVDVAAAADPTAHSGYVSLRAAF